MPVSSSETELLETVWYTPLMPVEVWSYRLLLRGKSVGSQVFKTLERGSVISIESKLVMQSGSGQQTVTQKSLASRDMGYSLSFQEELIGPGERRQFRLEFDQESGLVRVSRGNGDSAEAPYTRPYRDPLGLLHQVRNLGHKETSVRVPMLGKDVVIEPSGVSELDTVAGPRQARVYALYPGGSYVYVDALPPHTILKLTQRLDLALLDAVLIKIDEEDALHIEPPKPSKRKRRKRRRKRKRPQA